MDLDELEPAKKTPTKRNLDPMSVEELEGYIAELEEEILRVRQAIAGKKAVRTGAEALFRK
ncbi:MAG: DUF1192 domain-containing protein [Telmatospirillum sp.]|nr:DUF1192 domain-containing protein [Telmatospirillum sp.]